MLHESVRPRRIHTAPLLCAVLLSLSACGDAEEPLTTERAIQQVTADLNKKMCHIAWSCPSTSPEMALLLSRYADEATCARELGMFKNGFDLKNTVAGVKAGRQRFDAAKAQTCLDRLGKLNVCFEGLPGVLAISECDTFLTGLVTNGGRCVLDDDCGEESFCDTGNACYGTCRSRTVSCGGVACPAGQGCGYDAGGTPTCVDRLPVGAKCTYQDACVEDARCEPDEPRGSTGTCKRNRTVERGEACLDSLSCGVDLYCDTSTFRCVDVPDFTIASAGEGCSPVQIGTGWCAGGSACIDIVGGSTDAAGTCGKAHQKGAPCYFFFECAPGLYCKDVDFANNVKGACAEAKAAGESCVEGTECASEVCTRGKCAGNTETCIVP